MAKQKQQNGPATAEAESPARLRAEQPREPAKCPITREQFRKGAKARVLSIDGQDRAMAPKEFSTGSFGWYNNDKVVVVIDGVPTKCQINCSVIVVGSKELAK